MFVALGLKNAWRNRSRTALGIISMAIAAMIFMSGSTLGKGYPARAYWEARQMVGGEIILIPEKITLSTDTLAAGGYTWRFEKRSYDKPTLLICFDSTPYRYGFMRGVPLDGEEEPALTRIREVAAELRDEPFVAGVMVREAMPFLRQSRQDDIDFYEYGFIEPRDVKSDRERYEMEQAVIRGGSQDRYLLEGDFMKGVDCYGWQYRVVWDFLLPTMSESGYDYENLLPVRLEMVGTVGFQQPFAPPYANPVVFVTPETFGALKEATGIPDSMTTWGITVSVDNMADLESYVSYLRRKYPDFTVYGIPQLAAAMANSEAIRSGVPLDMRRVTEVLSFMIAALLSATNLSILMMARKTEIGILRALGATRWNITCMVLAESVWIALLGALIGSLITQPAVLYQLLSNKLSSETVLSTIGAEIGKSLGFSLCAAVVFVFLPVAKALRVTQAEVMRGE